MLATRGCLPFRRVEGKTQSAVWEYVVFCFQRSMNSASNGWSGTGPFDALLFGKPTWPHVQVRRTWIIPSAKLTSCHCKPKHSDIRSPVPAAKSPDDGLFGSEPLGVGLIPNSPLDVNRTAESATPRGGIILRASRLDGFDY